MENLPEEEWMRELETRLRTHTEAPDDSVWSNLAPKVQASPDAAAWVWWEYGAAAAIVLLVTFSLGVNVGTHQQAPVDARVEGGTSSASQTEALVHAKIEGQIPVQTTDGNSAAVIATKTSVPRESDPLTEARRTEQSEAATQFPENTSWVAVMPENSPTEAQDSSDRISKVEIETLIDTTSLERKRTPAKHRRVDFYTQLTPSLSFWHVQPTANDQLTIQGFRPSPVLSTDRLGGTLEAGVSWPAANKLTLTAGGAVHYQRQVIRYCTNGDAQVDGAGSEYQVSFEQVVNESSKTNMSAGVTAGVLYQIKDRDIVHRIGLMLQYRHVLGGRQQDALYTVAYRVEAPGKKGFYVQPQLSRALWSGGGLEGPIQVSLASAAGIAVGYIPGR